MAEILPGSLYLPDVGLTGSDERAASKAVREYDNECRLGQRRDTNEWIVYMTNPATDEPFPVLGLGTRLPGPDEIQRRMYQSDIRRHGEKLFRDIMRRQEATKASNLKDVSEASGEMADALVSGFRNQGHDPFPRIFIPKGVVKPT